jgi:hypothetical protein
MESRTQHQSSLSALVLLMAAALAASGCSSGVNQTNPTPTTQTAPAFVVGTDAPMASVVSFAVQIESVDAVDASGNSVPLLSGTPIVDFARYNGLQTLLDLNNVPVGTYNSVSITLGSATIGYLNMPASGPPTIETEAAVYPNSASTFTYTETLANPLTVAQGQPVGLRVDLDLHKTITVDGSGAITGGVTPTFDIKSVGIGDSGAYIDCFDAAVVSVNASGQSFVVQGPHGEQFTINVNGQTEWENGESISSLTTSSIVTVSGVLDKADQTLDADDVAILSQNGFYAGGQITYVYPSTSNVVPAGPPVGFDLYVRGLLPTTTGLTLGQIATVNLTGNEKYFIYWWHNSLTEFLFNPNTLMPGQHVSVGGPASGAANSSSVTVKRVVLRHWGFDGTVAASNIDPTHGTFQVTINGFAGLLIPQTVTVVTGQRTDFRGGLTGVGDLTAGEDVRIVGLLLKDPISGNPVLLAHYVDQLN